MYDAIALRDKRERSINAIAHVLSIETGEPFGVCWGQAVDWYESFDTARESFALTSEDGRGENHNMT